MQFSWLEKILIALIILLAVLTGVSFFLQNVFGSNEIVVSDNLVTIAGGTSDVPPAPHTQKMENPPEIVKAVYVTDYSASSKKYLNYLSNLFKTTEINAVVVDIKGSSGYVSYNSESPEVKKYSLSNGLIKDINALLEFFHSQNIYVIGRIAVFEDPIYSQARPELAIYDTTLGEAAPGDEPILWQDNNGLSWLDPASKDVWDYNISLAKDAFYHGFDEVNFDYVRFPSDGKTEQMGFPVWDKKTYKADVIKQFFKYVRVNLQGKTSVDLFGQTTTNKDDMGIGQIIENAFENFDYVCPMLYPSHYMTGFMGFENPADHPYEIVKFAMLSALIREKIVLKNNLATGASEIGTKQLTKFRPWLQDFNMGAYYTADMVGQEVKAVEESLGDEYNGFMLWNPSNIYTYGEHN